MVSRSVLDHCAGDLLHTRLSDRPATQCGRGRGVQIHNSEEGRVDGHTFTALQQSVTDFHAVLAWLLHPPRSEERVEAFARVLPIVAQLEALLAVIVQEKVPEAGEYLDAIHAAIQQIHANIAAGDITSEDARRILAELDQRRERMLARAQALADQKKGEEVA